ELLRVKYSTDAQTETEGAADFQGCVSGQVLESNVLPVQLAAFSGRAIMGAEFQIAFPDGERRDFFGNSLPLFDDAGAVWGGLSAYMDITDGKRRDLNDGLLQHMQAMFANVYTHAERLRIVSERLAVHFQLEQCLFAQIDGRHE